MFLSGGERKIRFGRCFTGKIWRLGLAKFLGGIILTILIEEITTAPMGLAQSL